MTYITVNGNKYPAVDMDINTVCDLEDMNITLDDYGNKYMTFLRGYTAVCMGVDMRTAGKELEQHIINGGSFDDVGNVMSKKIEESDFFRALKTNSEERIAESEK